MDSNRRDFMKWGGLTAAAVSTGTGLTVAGAPPAEAATAPANRPRGMAKGLTLLQTLRDGRPRLALKTAKGIVDVADAAKLLNMPGPSTLDDLLQNEDGPQLNALASALDKAGNAAALYTPENGVAYAPLVTRPGKILCVGLNYKAHIAEIKDNLPKQPVLFNKYNSALHPHGAPLKLPTAVATKFDYEAELVILMGKHARDVSEADALSYVAGYATGNDFTARDLQLETGGQWMVGKALDGFAPIGPYFVTADQVNPDALDIECRVNGETRQSSNTANMIFSCRQMISYISHRITLEPGDIIYTGTPEGVIQGMPKEKQKWLVPGDKIACSLKGLGELTFSLT